MSSSPKISPNDPIIDDFPVRPNTVNPEEIISPIKSNGQNRRIVILSLVYFLCGIGISIYGPLYPTLARKIGVNSYIYGSVIGASYFVCILIYPFACRMVSQVSSRLALSVSVLVIGVCRILFGTLNIISEKIPFISISYAIQVVEGVGMSILIACTVASCNDIKNQIKKLSYSIQASLSLGLIIGPIGGQVIKEELGFDVAFYIIGCLTVLGSIITASLLKESEQVTYADIPIVYWMKDKRMLIYFFIVFASFNVAGFLTVTLRHILKQFHLNNLYAAMVFSISAFVYVLSAFGWTWLIRKGFNNVMLIFIGALITLASLVLLGPVPYSSLEASLTYVCCALVLEGLGLACKSSCVLDASEKDLSYQKKYTDTQQRLIIPTVFFLGISLGILCGSLTAGLTDFYIGYRKGTLLLIALEICTAITSVIFAMNRNYVSKRHREVHEENQPILSS